MTKKTRITSRAAAVSGIVLACCAIVVSCSSFEDAPSSTDAGPDASAVEASPGTDASDGGADTDGSSVADGCAPRPVTCDGGFVYSLGFTDPAFPDIGWEPVVVDGSIARIENEGACAPGLFRASTTVPDAANAYSTAVITRTFAGPFSTARLTFSFRGPKPVQDGYANVGCSAFFRPTQDSLARSILRMTLSDDVLRLDANIRDGDGGTKPPPASVTIDPMVTSPDTTVWRKLETQFSFTPTTAKVTATFDGKSFPPFEIPLPEPCGRIEIECGVSYSDRSNTSHTIDIDDVALETCPP